MGDVAVGAGSVFQGARERCSSERNCCTRKLWRSALDQCRCLRPTPLPAVRNHPSQSVHTSDFSGQGWQHMVWHQRRRRSAVRRQILALFSVEQGLAGRTVRGIVQDRHGYRWLATSGGVSRYDGKSFRNFTVRDGLLDDEVWSLLLDRSGGLWIGTASGVSRFNGKTFSNFTREDAERKP